MKFSWKNYWKPTPKFIKRVADSILAGSTLAATFSYLSDHKGLAIGIMITSVVTTILSNFFAEA